MARRREFDDTKITFTLTKAGCKEGAPVTLTGGELADLPKMVRRKNPKLGPKTMPQTEATALFEEFVKRGLRP